MDENATVTLLILGEPGCGKTTFLSKSLDALKGRGAGERIPVMMLGLKRDLRVENDEIIYPQEAYRIAQELHCDRYAECSAVTGELIKEAFEDIAKVAALTTTEKGAQAQGGCTIM
uniref:GTP-binding protein RHO2 n=1 Tax=Talaromyces marneffei PM1 TaxID=1077442 RepID=A0A093VRK5_TALMA